ncbi:MAG: HAMP domain-containing protein [Leptospiraceae bacterium]|nr:HAMP domain-containing protein [Leptospiraceae bacterium]
MFHETLPFSHIDKGLDGNKLRASISHIQDSFIQQVILFYPEGKKNVSYNQNIQLLIKELERMQIRYKFVSSSFILQKKFRYYAGFKKYFLNILENGNCLIWYPSLIEKDMCSFFASLLASRKDRELNALQCLQLVRGNYGSVEEEKLVNEYIYYLKPDTKPSSEILKEELIDVKQLSDRTHIVDENPISEKIQTFKPSKLSIRVKLLSIISAILSTSLLIIIILATFLFKNNSEILIQEYNLSLARLTGLQVETGLHNTLDRTEALISLLADVNFRTKESEKLVARFYQRYPNYIYLSIWNPAIGLEKRQVFYSNLIIKQDLERIKKNEAMIYKENSGMIERALQGEKVLVNVSPLLESPILALFMPYRNNIVLLLIDSKEITDIFRSSLKTEMFELSLLSPEGNILAHSNAAEVLAAANKQDKPIVQNMMQSGANNGSQKYTYSGVEYLGSFYILKFSQLGVISSIRSDKVFEAVYKIQRQNFIITIIVLTLSFLIIYFFAKTITIPIIRLVDATEEIEKENFQVSIQPSSRDEIGVLTHAFSKMAKGLAEREKIKNTFGKFVNKEIAEQALHGEIRLGGTKKICAVLFSDLRGFTAMSEGLKPEEVVQYLNEYFTEMVECVYHTKGIVDKFIGDAIMAHWGALYSDKNDTLNAVTASLMMRKALIDFNKKSEASRRPYLRFGCGINTGPLIAGQIGSEKKLEYTVIGDTVNLASRIEYLNKEFGTDILISENAYEQVKDYFHFVEMDPIKIRGKSKLQATYAVLGFKEDMSAPANLQELRKLLGIPDTGV